MGRGRSFYKEMPERRLINVTFIDGERIIIHAEDTYYYI